MKRTRTSLPVFEKFSSNPRRIRALKPIPVLTLLGLTETKKREKRIVGNITKINLAKFPDFSDIDESSLRPLPGAPLSPFEVLQVFGDRLVPLEIGEILSFDEVWYVGDIDAKPFCASDENDYNDRKMQYRAMPNDHIAYRFQVLSRAGSGTFSIVYRCIDHKLGIPVAIKIIRSKSECMMYAELEANIQSSLKGNHSVRMIESFYFRKHFCLAMELLFADIYSIVEKKECHQLPSNVVRHITLQTLLCLKEMKSLGIVHADIKPENILTDDESLKKTKIADFGTACYEEHQIFTYIQSRYYRAPEVLYGLRYGPAIDMWSLGCVIYELIVGTPLFPAENEEELDEMLKIALGPPPIEIYEMSSKWSFFSNKKDSNLVDVDVQPLSYMLSIFPKPISSFIAKCLVWDPNIRLKPDDALRLEWLQQEIQLIKRKHDNMINLKAIKVPKSTRGAKPPWH